MNVLNQLVEKLDKMSKDFEYLLTENRRLKAQVEELKVQNDLLVRNSQDVILTIKNKLKEDNKVEDHNFSHK